MSSISNPGWTSGVIRASSFEEASRLTSAVWDLRLTPLAAGSLSSKAVFLASPRMLVYRERWNRPVHFRGALRNRQVAFAVPSRHGHTLRLNGLALGSEQVPSILDNGEFEAVTQESYDIVVMIFDADFLRDIATSVGHPFGLGRPTTLTLFSGQSQKVRTLRMEIERLLHKVEGRSAGRTAREAQGARLDERLADALLDALVVNGEDTERAEDSESHSQRYQMVHMCMDYARSRGFDVTIPELCALIGKSRRTLFYAFREIAGVSPARFLALARLRRVYWDLLMNQPEETTVTEVAQNWDFSQLGRFANTYKQVFGELPSQTLRRPPTRADRVPALRIRGD